MANTPEGHIRLLWRTSKVDRRVTWPTWKNNGLRGSTGRAATAGDNAAMESFVALPQKNVLSTRRWQTRDKLRLAIVVWIETFGRGLV